jgi:hypothetical protein
MSWIGSSVLVFMNGNLLSWFVAVTFVIVIGAILSIFISRSRYSEPFPLRGMAALARVRDRVAYFLVLGTATAYIVTGHGTGRFVAIPVVAVLLLIGARNAVRNRNRSNS